MNADLQSFVLLRMHRAEDAVKVLGELKSRIIDLPPHDQFRMLHLLNIRLSNSQNDT